MSKRILVLCCVGTALLVAMLVATAPQEHVTVMARADKQDASGLSYRVTVKRWQDHQRGGRYKRRNDRFQIDFLQRGKTPIASYAFEGEVPITKAVITWSESSNFSVAFDRSGTISCSWQEGKAVWNRK